MSLMFEVYKYTFNKVIFKNYFVLDKPILISHSLSEPLK